jgi:hypothetical protein
MRALWISFAIGFVSGGAGILAQPVVDTDTNKPGTLPAIPNSAIPSLRSLISFDDQFLFTTVPADALVHGPNMLGTFGNDENAVSSHSGWLKHFTIESFGYGPTTPQDFALSPGYIAALFNLQGFECPRCVLGPVTRSRFTLPPFGTIATLKLHDDRIELLAGFGGIEAWKPDGTFEPRGRSLWTNSYGDAWLTQTQAGVRVALDRQQRVSVGATGRHLNNFGSGPQEWSTFSGDVTLKLGH